MYRSKLADLIAWKNSTDRKPLIIRGARQTGKTWLMKEFGEKHYAKTVYINFEKSKWLAGLFADDIDIARIIVALQAESGLIITPGDTLLVFDEIQEVPEAITALKYFHEDGAGYHVIAASSLLGLAIHKGVPFPVGKVVLIDLSPMTFTEFLEAAGESALVEILPFRRLETYFGFQIQIYRTSASEPFLWAVAGSLWHSLPETRILKKVRDHTGADTGYI